MTKVLNVEFVYVVQKENSIIRKSHFHFWLFPHYKWMLDKFGDKISSLTPIIEYAKENMVSKENLNQVKKAAEKIRLELV